MEKEKTLIAYRPFFKFKKYEIEFYRKASEFFLLNVIQFWNNIDENVFAERTSANVLSSFNLFFLEMEKRKYLIWEKIGIIWKYIKSWLHQIIAKFRVVFWISLLILYFCRRSLSLSLSLSLLKFSSLFFSMLLVIHCFHLVILILHFMV